MSARFFSLRAGVVAALLLGAGLSAAPETTAEVRFFPGSGGRFEVAAQAGEAGVRLERLAEAAWAVWRGPLGLPERLVTGITVRLTPPEQWGFAEPAWRVSAEPTGLVSLWIRGEASRVSNATGAGQRRLPRRC